MDRKAILDKIAAMLKLQQSSTFDGEASAAAAMIDKLCAKYGVTIDEATTPEVLTEEFLNQKKMNEADFVLFCNVARFYDAKGYVEYDRSSGRVINRFKCIGTEAQQIQTKLYYEFIQDCMNQECDKAIQGERIIAELQGVDFNARGFRANFCKAFALKVKERLAEMKQDRGDHEHKEVTAIVVRQQRFGHRNVGAASGVASQIGAAAGSSVSLNKQATGRQTLQLAGR